MKGLDQCCAGIRMSYRYQPAINLHTYPLSRAEVKILKAGFSIEPQFSKNLKISRTHLSNCWFFHEKWRFFDVAEIPVTGGSLSGFFSKNQN
jgi:hypothetical protein